MATSDSVVFIDANAYLEFYRTASSRKLFDSLLAQSEYVFVTQQIADEVLRNKLTVARDYLAFKAELSELRIPPGLDDSTYESLRKLAKKISEGFSAFRDICKETTPAALEKISKSEDEISKVLAKIFVNAAQPSRDELERAQARKMVGNSPGKSEDTLGDQLNWEQLKSRLKGKSKLWLITADGDYCTKHGKNSYILNPMLRRELEGIEVFCFGNLADGIDDFAKRSGAGKEQLPTESELVEIKAEETSSSASPGPFVYILNEVMPRPPFPRARIVNRPPDDTLDWLRKGLAVESESGGESQYFVYPPDNTPSRLQSKTDLKPDDPKPENPPR